MGKKKKRSVPKDAHLFSFNQKPLNMNYDVNIMSPKKKGPGNFDLNIGPLETPKKNRRPGLIDILKAKERKRLEYEKSHRKKSFIERKIEQIEKTPYKPPQQKPGLIQKWMSKQKAKNKYKDNRGILEKKLDERRLRKEQPNAKPTAYLIRISHPELGTREKVYTNLAAAHDASGSFRAQGYFVEGPYAKIV